jgi:cytochrome c oxidase subunit 2
VVEDVAAPEPGGVRAGPLAVAVPLLVATAVAACGDDDDADVPSGLSAEARRGAEISDDNGCAGCHRSGAVGPSWEGLYGSTVGLDDGTTVVADDEYLARAITDPDADVVAGFDVSMPDNDLDDEEVAAVVAYIRELGDDTDSGDDGR